jgi:hypothetical protein
VCHLDEPQDALLLCAGVDYDSTALSAAVGLETVFSETGVLAYPFSETCRHADVNRSRGCWTPAPFMPAEIPRRTLYGVKEEDAETSSADQASRHPWFCCISSLWLEVGAASWVVGGDVAGSRV